MLSVSLCLIAYMANSLLHILFVAQCHFHTNSHLANPGHIVEFTLSMK